MPNKEQVKILKKKGVWAWNEWRKQNPRTKPDLVRADLREADLRWGDFGWRFSQSSTSASTRIVTGLLMGRQDFPSTAPVHSRTSGASADLSP
jgi:hypothetical protein